MLSFFFVFQFKQLFCSSSPTKHPFIIILINDVLIHFVLIHLIHVHFFNMKTINFDLFHMCSFFQKKQNGIIFGKFPTGFLLFFFSLFF